MKFGRENAQSPSGNAYAPSNAPVNRWTARRPKSRSAAVRGHLKADPLHSKSHPQLHDGPGSQYSGAAAQDRVNIEVRLETSSMYETPVLKRAAYLTSDVIILTLASPVFAIWWIVRTVRRMTTKS